MSVHRMEIEDKLAPYLGEYVEGVGGYKVARPLPRDLYREARKRDLVRRVAMVWYVRGPQGWKAPADRITIWERIAARLRGRKPMDDRESREYWVRRGGAGYDREAFSSDWYAKARASFERVAEHLDRDAVILEIGCGTGRNFEILREMGFRRFRGMDFSRTQAQMCSRRGHAVAVASARQVPAASRSVDVVLFCHILVHVPPPLEPIMREAARVARKWVVLMEPHHPGLGVRSMPDATPHCFRHDIVANFRLVCPEAPLVQPPGTTAFCFRLS
jgi:SAM-dependent methyltransferase